MRIPCLFLASALACAAPLAAASGACGDYPAHPVCIVVPYAAGGMTDLVARIVGQKLGEGLGQPVVIDSRPGASTITGADLVASARPDGYTLLAATNTTLTINPGLYRNLRYDAVGSFSPIALVAVAPSVIVVNPKLPAGNLAELVKLAGQSGQSGPDGPSGQKAASLSHASYGNGSSAHLDTASQAILRAAGAI